MNRQQTSINPLTVHPSISSAKLGRYRAIKGIFVIRQNDTVLYIGTSSNIYKAVTRLFQKKGALSHIDRRSAHFEIVIPPFRVQTTEIVLKRLFKPAYNLRPLPKDKPTAAQKRQSKRILESYLEQTRFDVVPKEGEHKSDN
ncbi:MAG: GIY-YIG nuclease family protein [Aureispira sp.]